MKIYYKEVLLLAIPNIISNITVPLLSMSDTMISGHMAESDSLAGIAVASTLVNTVYWLWGFLRMATTGLTAQAYGRGDDTSIRKYLHAGILISLIMGILIYSAKHILCKFTFVISSGNAGLSNEAISYVSMIFIGAPAVLLSYTFNGWFIGMQNTKIPMILAISTNIVNIALSIVFVFYMDMGVKGLALGTVLSQYFGIFLFVCFLKLRYGTYLKNFSTNNFFDSNILKEYFAIGKDLMLRTVMMSSIYIFFAKTGSSYGSDTVAANAIVMLLFNVFSYFMDGFAYASEALTGKYIGMQRQTDLYSMLKSVFVIGILVAMSVSSIYFFFCRQILYLISDKGDVIAEALRYHNYIYMIPVVSFVAFLMDGIFVGATESRELRNTMLFSFAVFFITYYISAPYIGASALWLGFVIYLSSRSLYQILVCKKVLQKRFIVNV